jgi:predicted secreted protein
MNSVAEAVKEITEKEDSCKDEVKKHEKRLHGKDGEVSKHVEKMHKEENELDEAEKVPTATGMRVYGSSYGNSAKARRDQVKKDIDTLKGPKSKDLLQKDKEDYMKTKGRYDEAAKPDFLDFDKDGDKKEPMKKAITDKKMKEDAEFKDKLIEALKGKQHKIDKNKNNKIDAQDFAILRGQQKEEVELEEKAGYSAKAARAGKDIGKPGKAFGMIAKKAGERYGSAEAGKRVAGAILAKLRKEEVEADWTEEQADALLDLEEKHMTDAEMKKREEIVKSMKKGFSGFRQRYGKDAKSVMYATATKQAMKEESVEEEIDPKVRTKDTLKGQEPTAQKDDVGPGSDAKSTKVKYRGGPMGEEVKKSDIPAFIRKARGDKPLTVADAKAGSKDSISSKENLAKARGVSEGKQPESDTVPFVTNADQPPFDGPYKKIGSTVTDKSGAKHTPMSRARDLARSAMKRIKTEMLGKAPGNNG